MLCYPNLGQVVIAYVLQNKALNHVLYNEIGVSRRTTNNEAYYIAVVEVLKEAKRHVANHVAVVTNS